MIQFMRGSAAIFEERNPILAAGQPGYEKDTGKLKNGDGTSPWMRLNYVAVGDLESIVDPEYSPTSARAQSGKAVHQAISEIVSTVDDPATAPIISIGSNPPDPSVNSVVYLQEIEPQADYVVQNGTSSIWTYRLWSSGRAECWGVSSQDISINQEWANGWKYGDGYAVSYPQGVFVEMPICTISKNNYNSLSILEIGANGTNTQTPLPRLICAQARASASQDISFYAIGRWK